MNRSRRRSIIPGFGLTLGFTVCYLSTLVLIPLAFLALRSTGAGWRGFLAAVASPRSLASLRFTFFVSFCAASINAVFGLALAWSLARYRFPGKTIIDAVVDLPLALPTSVAGIALTAIYSPTGWLGSPLAKIGIQVAFSWPGAVAALVFVGLPFLVRTVQPVIEQLDPSLEDAAQSLGANPSQTFLRVVLPTLAPALRAGFAASFARALGEYGSVVFIAGNMPMKTEISALLILIKLDQYDYVGASSLGVVMLVASLSLLLIIHASRSNSERIHGVV
jgi:sulfate transport system permease protein